MIKIFGWAVPLVKWLNSSKIHKTIIFSTTICTHSIYSALEPHYSRRLNDSIAPSGTDLLLLRDRIFTSWQRESQHPHPTLEVLGESFRSRGTALQVKNSIPFEITDQIQLVVDFVSSKPAGLRLRLLRLLDPVSSGTKPLCRFSTENNVLFTG